MKNIKIRQVKIVPKTSMSKEKVKKIMKESNDVMNFLTRLSPYSEVSAKMLKSALEDFADGQSHVEIVLIIIKPVE